MKRRIEAGGNSLDIADVYAQGLSGEIVSALLPQLDRDALIIASKFPPPAGPAAIALGANRKTKMDVCESSFGRRVTDYLDLCYVHVLDAVTPYEETLRALDDLVRQGKVRYVGFSSPLGGGLRGLCDPRGEARHRLAARALLRLLRDHRRQEPGAARGGPGARGLGQ